MCFLKIRPTLRVKLKDFKVYACIVQPSITMDLLMVNNIE